MQEDKIQADKQEEGKTHFGFKTVDLEEKSAKVAEVFHSVANKYDLMNDLMSFGIHRWWKSVTISNSAVRTGDKVLDLAGGTGDLTASFSKLVGKTGRVVLTDINSSMLKVAKEKLTNKGLVGNIDYVEADAENLPFEDNSFNCATIAFGLRNFTDKQKALGELFRVLKPGGKVMVLEFSKPESKLFSKVYDAYSFAVLPKLGKLITKDADSYEYLAESIRMHPPQEELKSMFELAGFKNVVYHNMTGGIVALHIGIK